MPVLFAIIIMGIVQGFTEFLPVSSSGHLVLLSNLFGIQESLFVSIILHVATLLSIVVVFWRDIWYYIRHPLSQGSLKIMLATIPTCIIVLILMPLITASFEGLFLPFCFIITAVVLLFTDFYYSRKPKFMPVGKREDFCGISYKQAIFMGIAQGFAVFPGISRSGSTICAGLISGAERENAARFSFLMSIPIILLSMVKEIYDIVQIGSVEVNVPGLIVGAIAAFAIGMFAIKFMMKLTQRVKFRWFGIYLVAMALISLIVLR